jgi:hypothetical protein
MLYVYPDALVILSDWKSSVSIGNSHDMSLSSRQVSRLPIRECVSRTPWMRIDTLCTLRGAFSSRPQRLSLRTPLALSTFELSVKIPRKRTSPSIPSISSRPQRPRVVEATICNSVRLKSHPVARTPSSKGPNMSSTSATTSRLWDLTELIGARVLTRTRHHTAAAESDQYWQYILT